MKLTTLAIGSGVFLMSGLGAMSAALIMGDREVEARKADMVEEQLELGDMFELSVTCGKLVRQALLVAVFEHAPDELEMLVLPGFDRAVQDLEVLSREDKRKGPAEGGDIEEGVLFASLVEEARELRTAAVGLARNPPPTHLERIERAHLLEQQYDATCLERFDTQVEQEKADAAATRQAESDALATLRTLSIALPTALFAVLALALALWLPRFRRRMRRIEGGAHSLGAGVSGVHIDIGGHDELAEVAGAFNKMSADLQRASQFLRDVYKTMPGGLIVFDADGLIEAVNDETLSLLQYSESELIGKPMSLIFGPDDLPDLRQIRGSGDGSVMRTENVCRTKQETMVPVLFSAKLLPSIDLAAPRGVVCIALDIRLRKKLELELRQAQKLESVGRLAAGIAHEINTPIQFVNDSVVFVEDAHKDVIDMLGRYRALHQAVAGGGTLDALVEDATQAAEDLDLDYLVDNVPRALGRARDGLERVAAIVRSMKEFAHPDRAEMVAVDLNHAILNTLTVTQGEYRHVADVVTELGDLPFVKCHVGEIKQALLNIIVNAAHAIRDAVGTSGARGRISVATRVSRGEVVIAIGDNGTGIPVAARERIFDPFFTTKEVGKGTGQGLAIAHAVISEKHGGRVEFETELGKGTTFYIRLPIPVTVLPVAA